MTPPLDRTERAKPINSALKRAVLERSGGYCEYCGVPIFDTPVIAESLLRVGICHIENGSPKPNLAVTRNSAGVAVLRQANTDGSPSRNGGLAPQTEGSVLNSLARYDHVMPCSRGGPTSIENVAACCKPCNTLKSDLTINELGIDPPPWFANA
jgi:hypothetical protein